MKSTFTEILQEIFGLVKPIAKSVEVIQKAPPPPPQDEYRIVSDSSGKFYAQVWGSMYGKEPKWLTIGNATVERPSEARHDEYLSHWLYPDDKFAFDSEIEAKAIIPRYIKAQGKKYGTDLKEIARYR